ncbi:hypothetical protein [Microvirga pudoricolor]|uniref:hypothetical protein n=1 Tax=Microvirga pudoricolor TaxID=2778729 RepID=UPI00194E324D|nr:hypothetical protein [Microvirga pudoricolor]MBM6593091.1 hypothetical protein [Microvirga pudoricolor]
MSKEQTGALLIRNLRLFEDASKLLRHDVEKTVFDAIDKLIEDWASKANWIGQYDFIDEQTWFAPPHWGPQATSIAVRSPTKGAGKKQEDDAHAWFGFWGGENDDLSDALTEDHWYLTRLCNVGSGELGFRWHITDGEFGIRGKKAKWKSFIRERASGFTAKGFKFEADAGSFFLPVRIDPTRLAQAYESGSVEDGLDPVRQALVRIAEVIPQFDRLHAEIRQEFQGQRHP